MASSTPLEQAQWFLKNHDPDRPRRLLLIATLCLYGSLILILTAGIQAWTDHSTRGFDPVSLGMFMVGIFLFIVWLMSAIAVLPWEIAHYLEKVAASKALVAQQPPITPTSGAPTT